MGAFRIRVNGELTPEQVEALGAAGVVLDDVEEEPSSAGYYGADLDVALTSVRVSADDESEASAEVADVLGVDPSDLLARPL
jgi:hypothetical protein